MTQLRQTATVANLKAAKQFYTDNPGGKLKVDWMTSWNKARYQEWFMSCLHNKINRTDTRTGRRLDEEYQKKMQGDGRTINAYYGKRIRHSGCNGLLATPELRARYPHINRQEREF
jgi:hypothetical protein